MGINFYWNSIRAETFFVPFYDISSSVIAVWKEILEIIPFLFTFDHIKKVKVERKTKLVFFIIRKLSRSKKFN